MKHMEWVGMIDSGSGYGGGGMVVVCTCTQALSRCLSLDAFLKIS